MPGSRNYLTKIVQENNCDALPAYRFEYYSPELLPYKRNYPVDFFGYFNDQSVTENTAFIPSVYQNSGAPDGERFRIYPKAGYATISSAAARNVNPSTVYYGALKKLIYPSGGFTQIAYEPNEYYDEATASNAYGAGVRVSSIKTSDGDNDATNDVVKNYEYKKANGVSSGKWLYNPTFAFADGSGVFISPDNLAPEETILYERASVVYPENGKTTYEYLIPGVYPQTSVSDWNATRLRVVSQTESGCGRGNLAAGYYSYPFAPNTNYDFEQGLVSKIQHMNEGGTVVEERNFAYQRLTPQIITIKALKLEKANLPSTYVYGLYTIMANVGKTTQTETVIVNDAVTPGLAQTTSTEYTYNSNQLLSSTSTTNSDGTIYTSENQYVKDFSVTNPSGLQAKMLRKLKGLNMHGAVVETRQKINGEVTDAALNLYDSMGTNYARLRQKLRYSGSGAFQNAALSGTPQQFISDPDYFTDQVIESYNPISMPLTAVGRNRALSTVLYAADQSTPVVFIANARGNEVVFADFESFQSSQLGIGTFGTDVWSGARARRLAPGTPLSRASVTNTGASYYRFRCRAKATTSSNVTLTVRLQNTSSGWNSIPITYSAAQSGTWVLLDQLIPMGLVAGNFTFELASDATIDIDDVAFYPENAAVSSLTFDPLMGKTSETDNRGNIVFYEYDWLGRLVFVRNTDKHIVQEHTYRYQVQPAPVPKSGFNCSGCDALLPGSTVTLTAIDNCMPGVTYAWKVDGVAVGSSAALTYTFTAVRDYEILLTVSHPAFGSSSTVIKYKVNPVPFSVTISGDNSPLQCNENDVRTYSPVTSGCFNPQNVTCRWYAKPSANAVWQLVQTTQGLSDLVYNFKTWVGLQTTEVLFRCEVFSTCADGTYKSWVSSQSGEFQVPLAVDYHPCIN